MYKIQHKNCIVIPCFTILRKDLLLNWQSLRGMDLIGSGSGSGQQADTSKISKISEISTQIKDYNLLQKSIFSYISHSDVAIANNRKESQNMKNSENSESQQNPSLFINNIESFEKDLALSGGILNEDRCMWYSFGFEGAKNSFEKVEYKKLKKVYKVRS